MHLPAIGLLRLVLLLSLLTEVLGDAQSVRLSFLGEKAARDDTVTALQEAGVSRASVEWFRVAVERYHVPGFELKTPRFPVAKEGFHFFHSIGQLVSALPHALCDVEHSFELNCFDTVIGLMAGSLLTTLEPNQIAGPLMVLHQKPDGTYMILPVATPLDAFSLVYSERYREITTPVFPPPEYDRRLSLTAALFRCHVLPRLTVEGSLSSEVSKVLKAAWKRDGTLFPTNAEVILCHEVNLPELRFVTAHAGLLIRRKDRYMYLEKAGGNGPFVRLDCERKADLVIWLSAIFTGADKLGYTHHFATYNDMGIEMLPVKKGSEGL